MKVLIVDDEQDLNSVLKKAMEMNGYDADSAFDGVEALRMLKYGTYDLAVIDVMMPRLDGISVVKKMRENNDNTPVIILTAKSELDDKVDGLDAGADDYLTKPFAIKELLARVRALTRRRGEVFSLETIGNLTLDENTYELKSPTETIRLTSKEFKLMQCFIRNKGNYLSTEQILENVWESDTSVELNVVWVFISSLRKKLDQIGSSVNIKAARGVGYRLEEK